MTAGLMLRRNSLLDTHSHLGYRICRKPSNRLQKCPVSRTSIIMTHSACVMLAAAVNAANPPPIEWQRSFGSTNDDACFSLARIPGGFAVAGVSTVSEYWLMKADAAGNVRTQQFIGGPGSEIAFTCEPTADGGFLIGGVSDSGVGGSKSEGNYGRLDYWVVRLDAAGAILWDRTLGGTNDDYLYSVLPTPDGGCLLGGTSSSGSSGNKTSLWFRGEDYWAVRLDSNGGKIWETSFGTTNNDSLRSVLPTGDGGFLLAGFSVVPISGPSGNRTSPGFGLDDFWVVRIDGAGNRQWEAAYGGTSRDILWCAARTADGGYVLGGRSASPTSGVKTSLSYGAGDYWLVRIDANGQMLWDRSFGGTGQDDLQTIEPTADGGFVLAGRSTSGISGNKTSPGYGVGDYWLVRVDSNGDKLWEVSLGGTSDEWPYAVRQMPDGGWLVGGYSASGATGVKTTPPLGPAGGWDAWLVKIGPDELSMPPRLRWERCCFEDVGPQYRLLLGGVSNLSYRTEVSTNFMDWTPFRTNQASGFEVEVFHGSLNFLPKRFFRARTVP